MKKTAEPERQGHGMGHSAEERDIFTLELYFLKELLQPNDSTFPGREKPIQTMLEVVWCCSPVLAIASPLKG